MRTLLNLIQLPFMFFAVICLATANYTRDIPLVKYLTKPLARVYILIFFMTSKFQLVTERYLLSGKSDK